MDLIAPPETFPTLRTGVAKLQPFKYQIANNPQLECKTPEIHAVERNSIAKQPLAEIVEKLGLSEAQGKLYLISEVLVCNPLGLVLQGVPFQSLNDKVAVGFRLLFIKISK